MPLPVAFASVAVVGLLLLAGGVVALRAVGARPGIARRLAGPREIRVGRIGEAAGIGVLRVAGRIRCRDPLETGGGERLVAFHRDVDVRVGRRWRTIERLRETRSFELWDHDGSVPLDPAAAADPLIAIPKVWRGRAAELDEPHATIVARLTERNGPIEEARATTRTLNVTDRLLVLARPVVDADGRTRLEPPEGGYLITNLALHDAMRLLGGRHRRAAAVGVVAQGLGLVLATLGAGGALAALIIGR